MNSVKPPEKVFTFYFNGATVSAVAGQTVAAALLAYDIRILRQTRLEGKPRGIFCGVGICFDCLVVVNGEANQRACLIEVQQDLHVETQLGAGAL